MELEKIEKILLLYPNINWDWCKIAQNPNFTIELV